MNPTHTTPTRSANRRRASRTVENPDYAAFSRRVIRAQGRRVADGDIEALPDLVGLVAELDHVIITAVAELRNFGYSWADIANRLGVTRQAAHKRWGGKTDA